MAAYHQKSICTDELTVGQFVRRSFSFCTVWNTSSEIMASWESEQSVESFPIPSGLACGGGDVLRLQPSGNLAQAIAAEITVKNPTDNGGLSTYLVMC